MNRNKRIYQISTALLALMYLGGGSRYFLEFQVMSDIFVSLGFPRWLHPMLGITKFMAAIFLWAPIPKWLKEWTYAGIFYNATLALIAHQMANEPFAASVPAILALVLVIISRIYYQKINNSLI